uniref:protein-ribulosamine 3-kinase n=1 Tax=Onchocerca volvulus TaxID=6282 RepID=A0A8R1TJT5_ONCVO
METEIRKQLGLKTLESFGGTTGGCISKGGGYHSDLGDLFIKFSERENAKRMFDGEFASLEALYRTETIRVPKPIKSISHKNRHCLITEYIDLHGPAKPSELGRDLARMHMHNAHLLKEKERASSFVGGLEKAAEPITQFGFHVPTCCGYLPQNNEWCDDWMKHNDRDLLSSWPQLERKIPTIFKDIGNIVPAIVHGDLWSGNYSYCSDGPVIFDPAAFYAHSEYELGIMKMFGGFGSSVYSAYHEIIPEAKGIEKRVQLYELFHHLNHWMAAMECFSKNDGGKLDELIFIHRSAFTIAYMDSRIHSAAFSSTYGSRSIDWFFDISCDRRAPQIRLAQRRMRIDETYPPGLILLKYYAVSRKYDQISELEMQEKPFSGLFVVPEDSEFFRTIFRTIHSQAFDGGEIVLTVRIIFKVNDFFGMLRRRERTPLTNIPENDCRSIALAQILDAQRDFKIMANDGEIKTSKYLLYLSTNYFHELITTNPSASSAVLNFNREIIEKVLDFAYKGIYNMEVRLIDKVRKFLQCVRRIRPLKQTEIINHISTKLNETLLQNWKSISLDDAVKILDIAYEQQFASLLDSAMNLIVDQYFIDFRYNEHSEGEDGELFQRLNRSEIADFLAPTNVMLASYRKRGSVTRILKYKTRMPSKRQFIE